MIAVSDTGIGMDEETQDHIFEPFFTTKEVGQGTGLGLATVYGIVKQAEGNIWVYSELGQGTTFKIYLPRIDARPETGKTDERTESKRGSETILIVEDEKSVQKVVLRSLKEHGYRVLTAVGGDEALEKYGIPDISIDMVITDVVMPGMSGIEFASRFLSLRPGTKILICPATPKKPLGAMEDSSRVRLFNKTIFIGCPSRKGSRSAGCRQLG